VTTEIIKIDTLDENALSELSRAAEIIRCGGLVVFPTETVYGLGADATNPSAANKIYSAKGRPSDNPLIIHVNTPQDTERYARTSGVYYELAKRFMPGPLTVVLDAKESVPKETRASLPTVAVRCPENIVARKLIELSGVAIAAPSANISGSPSPTRARHVIDDMMGRVDMIIDGGDCEFGLESTIVKIDGDGALTLLRPGKITVDMLKEVVDDVKIASAVKESLKEGERPLSPGMKYRHYAPKADMYLLDGDKSSLTSYVKAHTKHGERVALVAYEEDLEYFKSLGEDVFLYSFGKREDESAQAHLLFEILRDADKRHFEKIYAPLPDTDGIGLALYNRMIRAAAYTILEIKE
jgi:L-threonylcarbamoyladenylate synthase